MLDAILTIRTVIHRKYSTAGFFVPSLLYVYVGNNIDIYAGMEYHKHCEYNNDTGLG